MSSDVDWALCALLFSEKLEVLVILHHPQGCIPQDLDPIIVFMRNFSWNALSIDNSRQFYFFGLNKIDFPDIGYL
jgi:hypothetical protein